MSPGFNPQYLQSEQIKHEHYETKSYTLNSRSCICLQKASNCYSSREIFFLKPALQILHLSVSVLYIDKLLKGKIFLLCSVLYYLLSWVTKIRKGVNMRHCLSSALHRHSVGPQHFNSFLFFLSYFHFTFEVS